MWRGISLANKCLLLFGAAVILIIVAALSVPWLRMNSLVDEGQYDTSRQLVSEWQGRLTRDGRPAEEKIAEGTIQFMGIADAEKKVKDNWFVGAALASMRGSVNRAELNAAAWDWDRTTRRYWYARSSRDSGGALTGLTVLERPSRAAARQILLNTAYMLSAAFIAGGVAVLVFYLITSRIILSPVRSLKETAEQVREGDLATRSEISTGDEFEELSDTFNQMVEALATSQDQLRAINASLDLKLNELAERNVALYESNKLKGDFLANVSHELRTPLNSIIGFTEILLDIAEKEASAGDDSTRLAKRKRYLENIINSGRSLLEMINGLLEMAKVEAGKMELRVEEVNVRDMCEGLVALMRPLADRGNVDLVTELAEDLPMLETDAKKLQQIIFNFLSNAVKFTGEPPGAVEGGSARADGTPARPGRVTLRAETLVGRASEGPGSETRVRISVLDSGPGISQEDQKLIFEKFRQLESGHTRRYPGTGLGLSICKELTSILQGEILVQSELGRGSMFSVIVPVKIDPGRAREMSLEMAFRGSLAGRKGSEPAEARIGA